MDGLKRPKNGKNRNAPLLPAVKAALLGLLEDNPYSETDPDPFVFYSGAAGRPCDGKVLLEGLKNVMAGLGIDFKGRNISFHSWRHFFCSKAAQKTDRKKVALVSGHLTDAVFDKYAAANTVNYIAVNRPAKHIKVSAVSYKYTTAVIGKHTITCNFAAVHSKSTPVANLHTTAYAVTYRPVMHVKISAYNANSAFFGHMRTHSTAGHDKCAAMYTNLAVYRTAMLKG